MNNQAPAFQFYPGDWLSSDEITLLSPAEEGAYIRLLCYTWMSKDCSLPDDDKLLSKLSRLGQAWHKASGARIVKCFLKKNGRLFHKRLLKERKKQMEFKEKKREAGLLGLRKRYGKSFKHKKNKLLSSAIATPDLCHGTPVAEGTSSAIAKPSSSSSSSSSDINTPYSPPKGTVVDDKIKQKKEPYSEGFLTFWNCYPKQKGKLVAWKAWRRLTKERPPDQELLASLETQKQSWDWRKEGGKFIPHPATWLNQGRWADEASGKYVPTARDLELKRQHEERLKKYSSPLPPGTTAVDLSKALAEKMKV